MSLASKILKVGVVFGKTKAGDEVFLTPDMWRTLVALFEEQSSSTASASTDLSDELAALTLRVSALEDEADEIGYQA